MHLFHKKSGTLRPLPAGIPIEGTNYSELREAILKINPLVDEQIANIKNRPDDDFAPLHARQRKIHYELVYIIAPEAIGASESWLMEFNDQRCAMEMKGITLKRLLKEDPGKCIDESGSDVEYGWAFWEGYLDNYKILKYLLNRLLKELADYEHGKSYWIQNELPILEPPFQVEAPDAAAAAHPADLEKVGGASGKKSKNEKPKHVKFEKRVQGWYFNEEDLPSLTGTGLDDKERKKSEFHDRVVDGKSTTKTLIERSYYQRKGYQRCTEGFKKPEKKEVPYEYRLSKFKKLFRFPEEEFQIRTPEYGPQRRSDNSRRLI